MSRALSVFEFMVNYTPEQAAKEDKIRTARCGKTFAGRSIIFNFIKERLIRFREYTLLDFGCGPKGFHVEELNKLGAATWGEDLAFDHEALDEERKQWAMKNPDLDMHPTDDPYPQAPHDWCHCTGRRYDIVYASNVLNVQNNAAEIADVIDILGMRCRSGAILVNCPSSPWKPTDISPQLARDILVGSGFYRVRSKNPKVKPVSDEGAIWCYDPLKFLCLEEV